MVVVYVVVRMVDVRRICMRAKGEIEIVLMVGAREARVIGSGA